MANDVAGSPSGFPRMELAGLEPATSWVRSRRSPKLSYSPAGLTLRMVALSACTVPCRRRTNGRRLKVNSPGHSNFSGPIRTRKMSFRSRLLVFFMIIVIVPMIAVALVLFSIAAESETGKADAAIAQGLTAAFAIYDGDRADARDELAKVARDPALASALSRHDATAVRNRLAVLARSVPNARGIAVFDNGRKLV